MKPPITPSDFFKAAQRPAQWFLSAQRLRDAAEIILSDQARQEALYLQAVDIAGEEARRAASAAAGGSAIAQIACGSPNYLSGQLLYAFAMENALKGLAVTRNPGLIAPRHISKSIKSHDLVKVAKDANFPLETLEVPVLKALSQISEWAVRYPVATTLDKYDNEKQPYPLGLDPDALLNWRSQHPIMRACFDRMLLQLEKSLSEAPSRFGTVVAFKQFDN